MCYNKIYKFTDNVVCMPTYFKTIDGINSIIIIGNTAGLCGEFINKSNDDYYGFYPETNTDGGSEDAALNLDFIEKLIDKHAEIVIICNNTITNYYWNIVFTYFAICLNKNISKCRIADNINKNEDYENIMKNIIKKKHKFDVGFINAPYDNGLHRKFESMMFDLCNDEIVWVGPTNFIKTSNPDSIDKSLRQRMEAYDTAIIDINGNDFFDAATPTNMGIVSVNLKGSGSITYNGNTYPSCDDIIHPLELSFKNIVKPLYEKDNVKNHINTVPTSKFKAYINNNPDVNGYVYKFPRAAGDNHRSISESSDYYTIVQKGQYSGKLVSIETYEWFIKNDKAFNAYIPAGNKIVCKNLQNYLTGFFARLCLKFSKNSYDLMSGSPSKTIPWFDFSDSMFNGSPEDIDIALFRKYNISQEIVDHILQILPNYYDLDLSKYKNLYA